MRLATALAEVSESARANAARVGQLLAALEAWEAEQQQREERRAREAMREVEAEAEAEEMGIGDLADIELEVGGTPLAQQTLRPAGGGRLLGTPAGIRFGATEASTPGSSSGMSRLGGGGG